MTQPGNESGYEKLMALGPTKRKSLRTQNRHRERLLQRSICGGWTANPYLLCDHYCTYCITAVAGRSAPLMPLDEMKAEFRAALAKIPPCDPVVLGGISDAYPNSEAELKITRSLLPILLESGHPVRIVTKGATVTRDIDLLRDHPDVNVAISIGCVDEKAALRLEPMAPSPAERLMVIRELRAAGVCASVSAMPWVPEASDVASLLAQLDDDVLVFVAPLNIDVGDFNARRFCSQETQAEIDDAYMREFERVGTPDNLKWSAPPSRGMNDPLRPMAQGRLHRERYLRALEQQTAHSKQDSTVGCQQPLRG